MERCVAWLPVFVATPFLASCGATSVVERVPTLWERLGVWPYLLAIPVLLALLAAASLALAAYRTSRWRVSTGREGMIGEVGTVRRRVAGPGGGTVFVHGELWRAFPEDSATAPLEPGAEVEVVGFRRAALVVRPAKRR
jgi:membrane protein implicated in regulation of membrane protease activity